MIWELSLVIFSKERNLNNGHFFSFKHGIKQLIKTLLYGTTKFICGFWRVTCPIPTKINNGLGMGKGKKKFWRQPQRVASEVPLIPMFGLLNIGRSLVVNTLSEILS